MSRNYIYDGSFDGLLTAIFYAYQQKETTKITKENDYIPDLWSEAVAITTESSKADRVYTALYTKLSYHTLSNVYALYLSDVLEIETLILEYIKLCFKYSDQINLAKNNDIIQKVDLYTRRVHLEAHRFKGFVRFREIAPLVFYAQIEPDHNILPLIAPHFKKRFSDQHFVIHDIKRSYALVYNIQDIYLKDLSEAEIKNLLTLCSDPFETLFKTFYESINIKERRNKKQQHSYMPKRYWKHLIEIDDFN